ncbi:MAG: hypothetical protein DRO88_11305 [Promethearchaeia archaeon]|nr:MAG: hypothetical protein DRO88_11305 [Candidatus Lokiarchaeia archaeon]
MKIKGKKIIVMILIFVSLNFSPFIAGENKNDSIKSTIFDEHSHSAPKSSDISGNELFGEQILVQVAGKHSLIQQSYITNDTNIFDRVDLSDPAFFGSSFMIQVSNGIKANLDPNIYSNSNLTRINTTYQSMSGFLFYTNESDYNIIQMRKERAINIFKNIFAMDFILLDSIEDPNIGYFYPFFGYTPKWDIYFATTISNLPIDGYWGAFNISQITNPKYYENHHLSSSLIFMKNFSYLNKYLSNFNDIKIPLDFDFSSLGGSNLLNPTSGFSADSSSLLDLEASGGLNTTQSGNQNESLSYLENLENVLIYSVHYEGDEEGITEIGDKTYKFDLFKTLNYSKTELHVSEKIYNSFDGISLSTVGVGFFSSEILNCTPEYFEMDENYTNRIESMLFLVNQSWDLSSIKDYSFEIGWKSNEALTTLVTIPQNLKNESDYINLLKILGPSTIGMNIPSSYIKPLENLVCNYHLIDDEPSLFINKTIQSGNASRILKSGNNPTVIITAENRGEQTIWGQEINLTSLGISNDPTREITLLDLNMNIFELMGYDSDRIVEITTTLGYDINDLFVNENPRFFTIDSNDSGTVDLFYPQLDLTSPNLEFLIPYSPGFTQLLIDNADAYGTIANNPQIFNSSQSIFNPTNWKLDPGQNFTIQLNNIYNVSENYFKFQKLKVADLGIFSPVVSVGKVLDETDIGGTYFYNDSLTWNIESENLGNIHQIQQYLTFQNSSNVDLINNTLDSFNFEMNFTLWDNDTTYTIEIFDYTIDTSTGNDGFINILNNFQPQEPDFLNLTISSLDYNLSHFYDKSNNYSIILRITYENQDSFEMNFDLIELNFQDIRNDRIMMKPADIYYATEIGNNQYMSSSNSLTFGIDDGAHLVGITQLEHTRSYCGEILNYNLSIINYGNQKADNISIEIPQPGLIYNLTNITNSKNEFNQTIVTAYAGNFTFKEGKLFFKIDEILPGSSLNNISFQFYVPNSRLLPSAIIKWKDHSYKNYSKQYYTAESNQIYISAPVFYESFQNTPYQQEISVEYLSNFTISAPKVGDDFIVELKITNLGENSLYGVLIPIDQSPEGIYSKNNDDFLWIDDLEPFSSKITEMNFTKRSIKGYMIQQLSIVSSLDDQSLIFQTCQCPLVLGIFNLTISKEFETVDATTDKEFTVIIKIENNGNLELGNFTVFDISYDAEGFILAQGTLLKDINYLAPGDYFVFNYTLKTLNSKGIYKMAPAQVEYFFKYRYIIQNEPIDFKIREKYWVLTSRLYFPIIIGISIIFITKKFKTKYSREDAEYERRESLMFGRYLRESSWTKKNLTEFLIENQQEVES